MIRIIEHQSKGYSLIELIVVLFLTSMIVSIGIASFRHPMARYELSLTARQIENDLDTSRQQAMTNQQAWTVQFAPWNPRYSVWDGMKEVKTVVLPPGINYWDGYVGLNRYDVDFNYVGATRSGGRITLVNSYGDRISIVVYPITGEISVSDY